MWRCIFGEVIPTFRSIAVHPSSEWHCNSYKRRVTTTQRQSVTSQKTWMWITGYWIPTENVCCSVCSLHIHLTVSEQRWFSSASCKVGVKRIPIQHNGVVGTMCVSILDVAVSNFNRGAVCSYWRFLGVLAKFRKATISFVMSVRLSVLRVEQLRSHCTDFYKI
jgi:hypothetical protein